METGTMLYYDGDTWSHVTTCTTNWLWGVWGPISDELFVVGLGGTIIHYSAAWDPWSYDANEDGLITKAECVVAIIDYFSQRILKTEAVQVIILYFAGGG
jgi:hypothetical protein